MTNKDRALFASPDKKVLLSAATRTDLSDSIGTLLSDIQLSKLQPNQLDELALLVSERGVVFFTNQDLSSEEQGRVIEHYDAISDSVKGEQVSNTLAESRQEQSEWHLDKTFKIDTPRYSILKIEKNPSSRAEAAWISQYGLYDALSKHMQKFLDGLSINHVTEHQSSDYPAVRTHPVTSLKSLNVIPNLVTGFKELKKKESDNFLQFLDYHMHSAADQSVRWTWEAGNVAVWDNRCTAYRHISDPDLLRNISIKSTCLGEKPYFDLTSESRAERSQRLQEEANQKTERVEDIKARFNNTPLRRILSRQMDRDFKAYEKPQESKLEHKKVHRADSVLSGSDSETDSSATESREERTERWTVQVHAELDSRHRVHLPVQKSNTPLRRILERQLSSSLQRSVNWR